MSTWNWRAIRAMMRKDWQQVRQNRMVWLPMILVPVILNVILPVVLILLPTLLGPEEMGNEDLGELLRAMPGTLRSYIGGLGTLEQWVYLSANYMFAPMFLIVPIMVSSILACDSIVGERERRTLEGLLYTPMTDAEIFVSKVLGAFLPACLICVASFALYTIAVNVSGYRAMGRIFFPAATWWPLVFWMGPAVSVLALGATVLISSKAKTYMQAQQTSGMLVLPIVFMMIGQMAGLFFLGVGLLLAVGALVWAIGLWLVWVGARTLSRGELIARV